MSSKPLITILLFVTSILSCSEEAGPCSKLDMDVVCLASISGRIFYDNETPAKGVRVNVCAPGCVKLTTDENGYFEAVVKKEDEICRPYDFSIDYEAIHVTVFSLEKNTYAEFIAGYEPTQQDISDDCSYNLGKLSLYTLPKDGVSYTRQNGAGIDIAGVSFELEPGSLVENVLDDAGTEMVDKPIDEAVIKVFKAPLNEWNPPFNYIDLDAVYFIGPYWTKLAGEGVRLSIDPPEGWSEGDTGTFYMLSNYVPGNLIARSGDRESCIWQGLMIDYVRESELAECGTAVVKDGKVVTPPIPMTAWIGLKK